MRQDAERDFWDKVNRNDRGDRQAHRRSQEQFSAIAKSPEQLPSWHYGTNQAGDYGWP